MNKGYRVKKRKIMVPSPEVKKQQKILLKSIQDNVDSTFSGSSFGFRPEKGPKRAVELILQYRDEGYHWVASIDIKDCFPNIDPNDVYPLIDARIDSMPGLNGLNELPQGHPITPLLSNIYLDQFDKQMEGIFSGSFWSNKIQFIQYADDIWILAKRKKIVEYATSEALTILEDLCFKTRLQINHINQGVDMLGFTITRWSIGPKYEVKMRLKQKIIRCICNHLKETEKTYSKDKDSPTNAEIDLIQLSVGWIGYFGYDAWRDCLSEWRQVVAWIAMMKNIPPELSSCVKETNKR